MVMLGADCSPCCQCLSATRSNVPAFAVLVGTGNSPVNEFQKRTLPVQITPSVQAFDVYYTFGGAYKALTSSVNLEALSACAVRYFVLYSPSDGSHAYIEFENRVVHRQQQVNGISSFGAWTQEQLLGCVDSLSTFMNGAILSARPSAYLSPADASNARLFRSAYAESVNAMRWASKHFFTSVKIGYSTPAGEVTLFENTCSGTLGLRQSSSLDSTFFIGHDSDRFSVCVPYPAINNLSQHVYNTPRLLQGNRAFCGTFLLPPELMGGVREIGFGFRPPKFTVSPDFGTFGTTSAEFPTSLPPPNASIGTLTFIAPKTPFKMPCGDGFPGAEAGFSGGTLPAESSAIQPECRFPVRQFDKGQHWSAAAGKSLGLPLESCDDYAPATLDLEMAMSFGSSIYATAQQLWDGIPGFSPSKENQFQNAVAVAAAIAGSRTLNRIAGSVAAWGTSLSAGEEKQFNVDYTFFTFTVRSRLLSGVLTLEQQGGGTVLTIEATVEINGQTVRVSGSGGIGTTTSAAPGYVSVPSISFPPQFGLLTSVMKIKVSK